MPDKKHFPMKVKYPGDSYDIESEKTWTQLLIHPYKNYFNFKGRSNRKEYWLFLSHSSFLGMIFLLTYQISNVFFHSLFFLYVIFSILPSIHLNIRRLHDTNRSAKHLFILLIPYIGAAWVYFILLFLSGTQGENKYGPAP